MMMMMMDVCLRSCFVYMEVCKTFVACCSQARVGSSRKEANQFFVRRDFSTRRDSSKEGRKDERNEELNYV